MCRFISAMVLCATLLVMPCEVQAENTTAKEPYPFIIVSEDTTQQVINMTDEEFYQRSVAVYFRVNKTDINPQDPFIRLYNDSILPFINHNNLQLKQVFIRGAASPEGPYDNNQRLGKERTEALLSLLSKGIESQVGRVKVGTSSVTEDYGYLCLLMKKANDPDYPIIKGIYEKTGHNERLIKQQLMTMRKGTLWRRLLTTYYPQLRAARVVLWLVPGRIPQQQSTAMPMIPDTLQKPTEPQPVVVAPLSPIIETPEVDSVPIYSRRHLIALRTNLINDLWYQPQFGFAPMWNIQAEYYPLDGHYTYNLSFTSPYYHKWGKHKFFQIRDYRASVRRYFRGGGQFLGLYANAYVEATKWGVGFNAKKGWKGEGGGAGLGLGYVTPLNRKGNWRLELMLEAGVFVTRYDPYIYGNPLTGEIDDLYYYKWTGSASDFKRRNHQFTWFGPTMVGVQITYDIIYRHKKIIGYEKK